ncbi:MAG: hypothetical protein JWM62_3469 [Frankiales bacterium]|jgi:hypothetical protein|nr:hypothetical protein [Frankiales bacterium]
MRAHTSLRKAALASVGSLTLGLLVPLLAAEPADAATRCRPTTVANRVACRQPQLRTAASSVRTATGAVATAPVVAAPVTVVAAPTGPTGLLGETFSGSAGVFSDQDAFWSRADRGYAQNASWFAESGAILRTGAGVARTTSPVFRMWTRRTDLRGSSASMKLRFDGFTAAGDSWHGVNLWLNSAVCTPVPSCSAVDDGQGGNSGYALDFTNRDGSLTILKKVSGDTRSTWPRGAIDHAWGGTYYWMADTRWTPEPGRTYQYQGRAVERADGTLLQVVVDGKVLLQVLDNGSMGGPRLTGGRVGVRSDYANVTIDDLAITR